MRAGMQRFFAGFLVAVLLAAVCVFAAVHFGLVPATADVPPSGLERSMARSSLSATIAREAPQPPYPFPSSDQAIISGAKLYGENCSVCHGTASPVETNIAKGQYIKPPQLGKHGVSDDPEGKIYWQIEHGIRFTGMPSFKTQLTEEQIWQLTYFLKNAPDQKTSGHLPAAAQAEWQKAPV
jgi:thiosulfate dehydrogenase